MNLLTADLLKSFVEYLPDSGRFFWTGGLRRTAKGVEAGCLDSDGYLVMKIQGKMYKAHRVAWLYMTGEWPKGEIDHRNGGRADNRFENLRECSTQQNLQSRRFKGGVSGVRGVFPARKGTFRVRLWVDGKNKHFGQFDDLELAELVAQESRRKYFGEFAT